ncbi:MAG: STAS domain-containing protein [Alphaproteobacteria bacterium]|nr:STAS domain-containing protein [Alphaproteobacteria bacterium]
MQIQRTQENGITVLKVIGQLRSPTAPSLEAAINSILETENSLILDFSELDFLASSGIRVILSTMKKIKTQFGSLVVRNCNKVVMDVFEMTGLREILNIQ